MDSKIVDSLLLLLLSAVAAYFEDSKKDLYANMAIIIARWSFASEVFSRILVLYSIYYANGSPKKRAIAIFLAWYLDLLYPYQYIA